MSNSEIQTSIPKAKLYDSYSGTGKSLSEAPIFVSTNPHYDNRLFIELQLQYMKILSSVFVIVLTFRTIYVHNVCFACNFYVFIVP